MITAFRLLTSALLLVAVAGCGLFADEPTPADAASAFLAALTSGDNAAAGRATDDPEAATALLESIR